MSVLARLRLVRALGVAVVVLVLVLAFGAAAVGAAPVVTAVESVVTAAESFTAASPRACREHATMTAFRASPAAAIITRR